MPEKEQVMVSKPPLKELFEPRLIGAPKLPVESESSAIIGTVGAFRVS